MLNVQIMETILKKIDEIIASHCLPYELLPGYTDSTLRRYKIKTIIPISVFRELVALNLTAYGILFYVDAEEDCPILKIHK